MGEAAQAPGRAPSRRRRRLLRATALLCGAALLTGLLQAAEATSSQAQATTGSHTATLTLDGLSPRVPTADGSVTISGTVANNSKSEITDAYIGVRIGTGGPLTSRSEMTEVAARTTYKAALDGGADIDGHTTDVPDIQPGLGVPFTLKVPVSAFDLGDSGVYQLSVTLDGQTAVESWQHVLGIQRTFLPWYPDGESAKTTRISYLWPLTDRPHIAAQGDPESQQSPIFLDDDLAKELAPGGRLQVMVDLAKNLPVTWIVDPDLLASVEAMTKPYRVATNPKDITRTVPGTGTADAKAWINALRTAIAGAQVISLPFGDTDIASVAHSGQNARVGVAQLKTGVTLGKITTDTILGVRSAANVAWPVGGALDPSIVSVAREGGAQRIVAASNTFTDGPVEYTPTASRPIGHGTTAVVADAQLSGAFSGSLSDGRAEAAVQNFVAQTLMITMQAPNRQRSLLVAPQRVPSIAQAQAMAQAIEQIDSSPWAELVSFDTVAKAAPDSRANHQVPPARAYPKALSRHQLPQDTFPSLRDIQQRLNNFVGILTIQDRVTVPFRNAMLRAVSTGWRDDPRNTSDPSDPENPAGFRNSIDQYLDDLTGAVHVLKKTTLTLSGRSGTIPVTVKNDLGQAISGLQLQLTSGANIRLEIKNPLQPITIDGGHTRTLKFETKASANGKVSITTQLYTKDGSRYGQADTFDVKITKVTDLVMLIIAVGLLLLVLAGVRIYRQRKRQAASGGDDGGSGGGSEGNGAGGGSNGNDGDDGEADSSSPGQPGDPAADTAPQSPEPSPAGEKVDG
ncbi:DUF6049 family protein [Streptomyces sp. NBC_01476]|uniref:DUF6049 family protein n=1 Tax=Streptomyces sp. NBC_01476 TaxID=2903881 RepID=UPI002E305088|nr:DUF6049 family protein [Streptomyces sp. NBC_01476]